MSDNDLAVERRLSDAEHVLYHALVRRGLQDPELWDTWEAAQEAGLATERDADPYISYLSGLVAALGGKLEVRAVFPDETVTLYEEQAEAPAEA